MAATTHTIEVARPKPGPKPELVSARLIRSLVHPARQANVVIVRYSADGSRLFTAGYPSGVLQFWDVTSGKELRRIETPAGYRGSADYAELPADWSTAYVPWEKRKVVRVERNGKRDYRIEYDGGVLVYDAASGRERPGLKPAHGHSVVTARVSPDGSRLVALERPSADHDQRPKDSVVLWDTHKASSRPIGQGYPMAAFTADSKQVVLALIEHNPEGGFLKLLDAEGNELAKLAQVEGEHFTSPVLSPDGKRVVAEESKGRIDKPAVLRVWDLETRKEVASFASGGKYPFLYTAWSPDGNRLAATDYDGGVRVWDVATTRLVMERRFGSKMWVHHVAFSPDGRRLAVNAQQKSDERSLEPDPADMPQPRVYMFDLANVGAEPETIICPHGYVGGLAFAPDGRTLAVGGAGAVHLFDMTEGRAPGPQVAR